VTGHGDEVEPREGLDLAESLGEAPSLDDGGHGASPRWPDAWAGRVSAPSRCHIGWVAFVTCYDETE
jgi:hypothetical protein